jgi:hypothetical protein
VRLNCSTVGDVGPVDDGVIGMLVDWHAPHRVGGRASCWTARRNSCGHSSKPPDSRTASSGEDKSASIR